MAEQGGFVYIEPDQADVFYQEFLQRMGETAPGTIDQKRLGSNLDRCMQMAQAERGDMVRLFSHLVIQFLREKDRMFSSRPMGASMAILMAWLYRNGIAVALEPDELVAAVRAIAAGGVYLEDLDQYLRQYMRSVG